VAIDYPKDRNWLGMMSTQLWKNLGDIVRDLKVLFKQIGFQYTEEKVGCFDCVHLYSATKEVFINLDLSG
jgi:hypothetical protein